MPTSALRCLFLSLLLSGVVLHAQPALRFIENRGQWPQAVTFKAEVPDATIWCERGSILVDRYDASAIAKLHAGHGAGYDPEASRTIRHHALRLRFLDAPGPVTAEIRSTFARMRDADPDP